MPSSQVNVPKTRRTYCKGKDCKKHTQHKVTQYKAGKVGQIFSARSPPMGGLIAFGCSLGVQRGSREATL